MVVDLSVFFLGGFDKDLRGWHGFTMVNEDFTHQNARLETSKHSLNVRCSGLTSPKPMRNNLLHPGGWQHPHPKIASWSGYFVVDDPFSAANPSALPASQQYPSNARPRNVRKALLPLLPLRRQRLAFGGPESCGNHNQWEPGDDDIIRRIVTE